MGVRAPEETSVFVPRAVGPSGPTVVAFGLIALALLVCNGRPIPETPDAASAYAGKALAALAAAAAAAALFGAMGRAHAPGTARSSALVLTLGTTVWAVSQHLGPQAPAVLAMALAVLFLLKAGDEDVWAGRVGLPLGLAVAAWPASGGAAAVLAVGAVVRWPRATPWLLAWSVPPIVLRLAAQPFLPGAFQTGLEGFGEGLGVGHLGLLVSPAKGLLVFTPVVIVAFVGMARSWGWGERWLVATLGSGFVVEWIVVGATRTWHGSPGWGPVGLTSALPLVFLFLPEGLEVLPRLGAILAAFSIAVQALGAFAADGRWERLYQARGGDQSLWDVGRSPLAFYARRRVLILAMPEVKGGRWRVREHRLVAGGAAGSRFAFADDGLVVKGADANASDAHLVGGAKVEGDRAILDAVGDGIFLRVRPSARLRALELRLRGRGEGLLAVGEGSFWSAPRVKLYPVAGPFFLRHRYLFAESGGGDLTVVLERGRAALASVALVAPGDPENPIEAPR
jgi:hypothetical protein